MAELSGGAAAVENQQRVFILRQFGRHFIKLAVGDADRRWNMAFVIFGLFGP